MEWIQTAMTIWMVTFMVFKMNPLNDPNNPASTMCSYNPENIRGRAKLELILKEERTPSCCGTDTIILWPDVWPYLATTIVSGFAWIVYIAARVVVFIT